MLAKKEYDRFGAHLQYSICRALGIEMTAKWNTGTHTHTHTHRHTQTHTNTHKAKPAAE